MADDTIGVQKTGSPIPLDDGFIAQVYETVENTLFPGQMWQELQDNGAVATWVLSFIEQPEELTAIFRELSNCFGIDGVIHSRFFHELYAGDITSDIANNVFEKLIKTEHHSLIKVVISIIEHFGFDAYFYDVDFEGVSDVVRKLCVKESDKKNAGLIVFNIYKAIVSFDSAERKYQPVVFERAMTALNSLVPLGHSNRNALNEVASGLRDFNAWYKDPNMKIFTYQLRLYVEGITNPYMPEH